VNLIAIHQLFLLALLSSSPLVTFAQTPKSDLLVSAEITGEGKFGDYTPVDGNYVGGYFVRLTVQNNLSVDKELWVMSCSWNESWLIDNPSLWLYITFCLRNTPDRIILKPGEILVFNSFLVKLSPKSIRNKIAKPISPRLTEESTLKNALATKVKFGFSDFSREHYFRKSNNAATPDSLVKTWWSNPVDLRFSNNSYHKQ